MEFIESELELECDFMQILANSYEFINTSNTNANTIITTNKFDLASKNFKQIGPYIKT